MTEDLFKHDTDGDRNISYQEYRHPRAHNRMSAIINDAHGRYLDIVYTSDMLTAPAAAEGAAAPPERRKATKAGEYL